MSQLGWLTNDQDVAKQLRKIDRAFDKAMKAAGPLQPLSVKVEAIRKAKMDRLLAYGQVS